ncbi:phage/plasmid primase, P4 family [Natroniella sulfidigena]|uniref:phage/plasmid primase, P4 family n=1 Tax=Natroniella sulfidigena TaxID=723921 RepID=UPI00200B58CF|nr:phage/plasmid primase, P4 family [Natroniella sulfidigena]MCK8818114.1 phage/plasmid primase, P4 family [Natroniella sulfidigena]
MTSNNSISQNSLKINDEVVEELKQQLDIREVVELYADPHFKNKKALCPFHSEKTPSFVIYPDTSSFYCFGCGAGGDVIRFVELHRRVDFIEAIEILAGDFNLDLPSYSDEELKRVKKSREAKQLIKDIYKEALNHFQKQLKQEHIEFLTESYGLARETIEQAKIGYCKNGLLGYLRNKGFADEEIYQTGLVTKKNGNLADRIFNSIMIPYLDNGQVVYFKARLTDEKAIEKYDKYMNLKHTSEHVTNSLYLARVEGNNTLILTEGEIDAIAATELVDHDVVALGKAGLSNTKKKELFKLAKRYEDIVIINDTDENEAGMKGSIQTAKAVLGATGFICKVGQLEQLEGQDGTDIADYNREGKELEPIVDEAQKFTDLLQGDEFIEIMELLISALWKFKDIRQLSNKVKSAIPLMADLNRIDSNMFIENIRGIVKKKTGSKNTLGTKQDFLAMINEEKRKGKDGNKFNPTNLGQKVIERIEEKGNKWGYLLIRDQGIFYFYDDKGYWKQESATYFKNEIREVLKEQNEDWERNYKVREVLEALKQGALADRRNLERFDAGTNPDLEHINCKNGMLEWKTGQLKEHDPSYYSLFQMNVTYDPKASCPNWKKALNDWIPDPDTIKFLQEFAGYCLIADTSHQKALILYGDGRNGKSVFLEVLEAMYGKENCGSKTLSQINSRFGKITIKDNLVNIAPDIDPTYLENSGTIKNIIRGEGISGEWKRKDAIDFRPVARLLFSCNELPRSRDKSEGWLRSFEIVKFPNKFKPTSENYDPDLKEKLINELDGIFNWALEGLRRLKEQKHFTISDGIKKAKNKYRKENDTVQSFVEEICELDPAAKVTTEYLFRKYNEYCKECNYKPVNRNAFVRTLKKLGLPQTNTTFEVCIEHGRYNCNECYNPTTTKKRRRGFKGLEI